jgi:hypothetical protein
MLGGERIEATMTDSASFYRRGIWRKKLDKEQIRLLSLSERQRAEEKEGY